MEFTFQISKNTDSYIFEASFVFNCNVQVSKDLNSQGSPRHWETPRATPVLSVLFCIIVVLKLESSPQSEVKWALVPLSRSLTLFIAKTWSLVCFRDCCPSGSFSTLWVFEGYTEVAGAPLAQLLCLAAFQAGGSCSWWGLSVLLQAFSINAWIQFYFSCVFYQELRGFNGTVHPRKTNVSSSCEHPHVVGMPGEVTWSVKHFWSLRAKQSRGILMNNWSKWRKKQPKRNIKRLHAARHVKFKFPETRAPKLIWKDIICILDVSVVYVVLQWCTSNQWLFKVIEILLLT